MMMMTRRLFLLGAGTAAVALSAAGMRSGPVRAAQTFEVAHTEDEWRKLLTPEQFAVLRQSATERLRTARSAVGLAEEALRIVRERYGEGMAVMVELLGAEAAHTAALGARAAAAHDLALADAALDLATGRPVTGTLESSR